MSHPVPALTCSRVPELVAGAGERASMRCLEFFAANIRNPHTRRAYARAADEFLAWCASAGVSSIVDAQPVHVATWIETATRELAAPSVKQRLAAIRHLFDWLVTGQVVPVNPAGSVRGPRHVVTSGQTPVLDPAEARALLDSIDVATHAGLRDRALIALMVYSFARIGAALGMAVEDVFTQNRRLLRVRLREKGRIFSVRVRTELCRPAGGIASRGLHSTATSEMLCCGRQKRDDGHHGPGNPGNIGK